MPLVVDSNAVSKINNVGGKLTHIHCIVEELRSCSGPFYGPNALMTI